MASSDAATPVDDGLTLIGDEVREEVRDAVDTATAIGATATRGAANPRSLLTGDQRAALVARLGAAVRLDEPMRRHTTLKIGGPADALVAPTHIDDVRWVAQFARDHALPMTVVGGGSNLLVRDGGIRGLALSTDGLRALQIEGTRVVVEAGVTTGKLLSVALAHELGGVEFLGGVPGTVGGGLIMNAGTYMGEFTNVVTEVTSVSLATGALVARDHAACGFGYRTSLLGRGELVVAATLALVPRPRADMEAEIRALRQRRHEREPKKVSSAGSIFKNPAGDFAGRLIEACGLKGTQIGGALCSPVYANWLVNVGGARAADLLALIDLVRNNVAEVHGIQLQLEVKVVGDES